MTVFGIAMMKDEEDIAYWTVKHMLTQVNQVIVLDNNSSDNTRLMVERAGGIVFSDPEVGYYQSEKMTALAQRAAIMGADWVVPFDADEIWYSPFHARIGDFLEGLAPQWLTATATIYNHITTGFDDPNILDPTKRIGWRWSTKGALPKVACRTRLDLIIEQGNHGAHYSGGATTFPDQLVIRHYPYRSAEHFVRKARNGSAAYAATDLPYSSGEHWRKYGQFYEQGGFEECASIYYTWFHAKNPYEQRDLIFDPAPIAEIPGWQ